jgi:hypothetical protein
LDKSLRHLSGEKGTSRGQVGTDDYLPRVNLSRMREQVKAGRDFAEWTGRALGEGRKRGPGAPAPKPSGCPSLGPSVGVTPLSRGVRVTGGERLTQNQKAGGPYGIETASRPGKDG